MKRIKILLAVALLLFLILILSGCAEEFTVTFDSQGGSSVQSQTIKRGEIVREPLESPKKDGYFFGGWFKNKNCKDGKEFNFNAAVTKNTTLYAKWIDYEAANTFMWGLSLNGDGYIVKKYIGSESTVVIPAKYCGKPVIGIGDNAFYRCTSLVSVIIPDSVTSISFYAFIHCSSLKNITIPNGVTSIGDSAFYNCSSLENLNIPDNVTHIGSSAFYNTAWYNNQPDGLVYAGKVLYELKGTSQTDIALMEGTKSVADHAFSGYINLTSIIIPSSVESVGRAAFWGCSSLTIFCEASEQPSGWNSDWNYDYCPVF